MEGEEEEGAEWEEEKERKCKQLLFNIGILVLSWFLESEISH